MVILLIYSRHPQQSHQFLTKDVGSMADLSDMALRIILGVVSAFTAAARFAPGFVLGAGIESDRQKHADAARLAMRSLKLGS
jgi:hypothetical protein